MDWCHGILHTFVCVCVCAHMVSRGACARVDEGEYCAVLAVVQKSASLVEDILWPSMVVKSFRERLH